MVTLPEPGLALSAREIQYDRRRQRVRHKAPQGYHFTEGAKWSGWFTFYGEAIPDAWTITSGRLLRYDTETILHLNAVRK
jgi:hypothetical protein